VPAPQTVAAAAEKRAADFALASSDLTASRDVAVSGEVTESQIADDEESGGPAKTAPAAGRKAPVMRFKCPHCSRTLTVAVRLAGQVGKCAGCNQRFTAPVPEAVKQLRAKLARDNKPETSLRDAFSIVKLKCTCGMTSAHPKSKIDGGEAECPACDRNLSVSLGLGLKESGDE
jgi:hypothetical protein